MPQDARSPVSSPSGLHQVTWKGNHEAAAQEKRRSRRQADVALRPGVQALLPASLFPGRASGHSVGVKPGRTRR